MIESLKVTVVVENTARMGVEGVLGKHGFCALIEAKNKDYTVKVLLDAGPSPDVLLNNLKALNLDLSGLDVIVVSHGHYDHTGGLLEVLKMVEKPIPVIIHPDGLKPKFSSKPKLRYIGNPFKESDIEAEGGILVKVKNPVTIIDGLTTTGEIERATPYERPKSFWTVEDGRYVEDLILDDQALAAKLTGKGLVVITGCAHSGIVNTILHSMKLTGSNRVHAVLGGFHLVDADDERLIKTVERLRELGVETLRPGHCTGSKAVNLLTNVFGGRCKPLNAGDVIEF